jgi:hypothetical protein
MKGSTGLLRGISLGGQGPEALVNAPKAGESPAGARGKGRRQAVVSLVVWSFVVVLTPIALGSAWKLVYGFSHWMAHGLARAWVGATAGSTPGEDGRAMCARHA